jgi:type 1 glutamine amidotransferase
MEERMNESHPEPDDARRRCLIVRGGWEGHVPVEGTDLFLGFLDTNGFDVVITDDPEVYADPVAMGGVDLIVQSVTMGRLSTEGVRGLASAIAAGVGFTGWHGGIIDSFRSNSDYNHLVGAMFVAHPGKDPAEHRGDGTDAFTAHLVTFTDEAKKHPITTGLVDFELVTENYWVLHDDYIDVLATSTNPAVPWGAWHRDVVSPAVYTRAWGSGRIAVVVPGHDVDVLSHPTVRTLIERSMLWASR